jgi:hypothetical protein
MDRELEGTSTQSDSASAAPQRLEEVLKVVKLELVSASVGVRERGRGFNPYDGRLGRNNRDVWGKRRRA